MKKRIVSILLALAMVSALIGSSFAAARWDNVDDVDLFFRFDSNGTATCTMDIFGKSGTSKIVATLELQVMDSRGNYIRSAIFPTQTSYSSTLSYTGYAYNRPAGNYRLTVNATVYNELGVGEPVTSSFDKTFNG